MEEEKLKSERIKNNNAKQTKVKNNTNNKKSSNKKSKNKKSNGKLIGGIVIVLLVILLFGLFELFGILKKEEEQVEVPDVVEHSQEYEKIMSMDFQNNYPDGYLQVVEANNEIVMFEYGEEIQFGEATDVITKQRELFATELNDLNPVEVQVGKYIEDASNYRGMERYIVSRKILTSEILSYDGNVAEVVVDEVFNDGLVVQYTYYLVKEDDKWRIFSWERRVIKSADNKEEVVTEEQKK